MMQLSTISIEKIRGSKLQILTKLKTNGILTVQDFFNMFPKKYENFELGDITKCKDGETITLDVSIVTVPIHREYAPGKTMLSFRAVTKGQFIDVVIFNRDYLKKQLDKGTYCYITGKVDLNKMQVVASKVQLPSRSFKKLKPVYGIQDVYDFEITKMFDVAFKEFGEFIDDDLPSALLDKYELVSRKEMLKFAHYPMDNSNVEAYKKRAKFEELFKFQLRIQYLKLRNLKLNGTPKEVIKERVSEFISSLPFELTADQTTSVDEIIKDLQDKVKMNRLLQGDVGSGKTLVAAITMYAAITAGFQTAIMAPTEILAEQHFRNISKIFEHTDVRIELLTGSIKGKKREAILSKIILGEVDIVIGTHALISDDVVYNNLGLVVTDEQHRFGVNQRKALKEKGLDPDVLFMTATPIPRTLAITLFGDMEVSTIKELPKGRIPIMTSFMPNSEMKNVYQLIQDYVNRKEQVYVVAPLIDESEKLAVKDATTVYKELVDNLNGMTRIGILHGKMKADEKEEVMRKFISHEIDVLVSTTVIEVGVDVKNATLMVILDAHRFGLSQLHQLRGRIGRGDLPSTCVLVNEDVTHRIQVMLDNIDGFIISEEDLKLRGPGDVFGSKQSGVPEFSHANIIEDYRILEMTRRETSRLVHQKAFYQEDMFKPLRLYLKRTIEKLELE